MPAHRVIDSYMHFRQTAYAVPTGFTTMVDHITRTAEPRGHGAITRESLKRCLIYNRRVISRSYYTVSFSQIDFSPPSDRNP